LPPISNRTRVNRSRRLHIRRDHILLRSQGAFCKLQIWEGFTCRRPFQWREQCIPMPCMRPMKDIDT
jgi:hypothetical protein